MSSNTISVLVAKEPTQDELQTEHVHDVINNVILDNLGPEKRTLYNRAMDGIFSEILRRNGILAPFNEGDLTLDEGLEVLRNL